MRVGERYDQPWGPAVGSRPPRQRLGLTARIEPKLKLPRYVSADAEAVSDVVLCLGAIGPTEPSSTRLDVGTQSGKLGRSKRRLDRLSGRGDALGSGLPIE